MLDSRFENHLLVKEFYNRVNPLQKILKDRNIDKKDE